MNADKDVGSHDPKDYYFQIDVNTDDLDDLCFDGMICVMICPKSYYDVEGYLYDEHVGNGVFGGNGLDLPEEFDEMMEATFFYRGDEQGCRNTCLELGMEEKNMFS